MRLSKHAFGVGRIFRFDPLKDQLSVCRGIVLSLARNEQPAQPLGHRVRSKPGAIEVVQPVRDGGLDLFGERRIDPVAKETHG